MNIFVNKIQRNNWISFFNQNEFATPFQSPEFFDFINEVPNHEALVYTLEDPTLKALCVATVQKETGAKGYFSRRVIIYGGILIEKGNVQALEKLLKYIYHHLRGKAIYIEVRNYKNYELFKDVFKINNWKYAPYLNYQHQFNCYGQTLLELMGKMKYNRRREIKLSLKEGAIYSEAKLESEVKELYEILFDLYQNKVKLPLPDVYYFLKLFHSAIGKIFVVKHNGRIIGGSFCVFYEKLYIYTMYYCGIRDYNKRIFPTHLAILAVMQYGIDNNLAGLDLMGAGKPDEEYGVRYYKAEFGGELVEQGRFIKIVNAPLYKFGKLGLKILQKINK